jgi:hypothetical protein
MTNPAPQQDPACGRCRHYRVTWQPHQPHACLAFGFQSRVLPSQVVRRESGQACGRFEPRPGEERRT